MAWASRDRAGVWATAWVAAALAGPATAQVLEIRPDGGVVTYSGPAQYSDAGVRPLIQPAVIAIPASRAPPAEVAAAIQASSQRHGVSADLIQAVAWQESRYRQTAVSPKGARGVMQLMPRTARDLGADAHDLAANIDGGAAYLAQMMRQFGGDLPRVLAAYNAGPAAVARFGGIPPYAETRAYVSAILGGLEAKTSGLQ